MLKKVSLGIIIFSKEFNTLWSLQTGAYASASSLLEHRVQLEHAFRLGEDEVFLVAVMYTYSSNNIRLWVRFICIYLYDTLCRRC